jgi:hypothetical protein
MSELKNGPFVSKLVQPEDTDETVIDPLAYCSGRELGKFSDNIEMTTLEDEGTIRGRPSRTTLEGEEIASARKLNYTHVDTGTGFYSPASLDSNQDKYSGKELPAGTVIIGRMRPYLNNTTVLDPELLDTETIVSDSEWLIFEPDDGLLYFWSLVLRTNNILRQFSITRGQTRPRLHEEDLKKISVPVIDQDKREEINAHRQEMFRDLQRIEREITETATDMHDYLDNDGSLPDI